MVAAASVPASNRDRTLCVSVVSHGQGRWVDALLADLAALPVSTVAHVIVTVNQPEDDWLPKCRIEGAEIEVLRNAACQGFGANHNRAFEHCAAPHFAVVNPDIRLPQDPFAVLLDRLAADPHCALAVPVQTDALGRTETFARRVPTPLGVLARRLLPRPPRGDAGMRAQWVAGAFMLWRSDVFRELGGFDADYFLYCEDVDICLRLQLAGQHFAVVENARVVHDAQRASRGSPRYFVRHVQSLCRLWASPVFWRFLRARRLALAPA